MKRKSNYRNCGPSTTAECDANARLIAAAPDLLESCKRAGDTLAWLERKYGNLAPEAAITESVNDIRAAIAKAEKGGAQ